MRIISLSMLLTGCDRVKSNTADGASGECAGSVGAIFINEFVPDPVGADSDGGECVELFVGGDSPVDVSGYRLAWYKGDAASASGGLTFPDLDPVEPGQFFVVCDGDPSADLVQSFGDGLGNATDGDRLELLDCDGAVVDAVVYGCENGDGMREEGDDVPASGAPAPDEGGSIQRRTDGGDSDNSAADFCGAASTLGGPNGDCDCEQCGLDTCAAADDTGDTGTPEDSYATLLVVINELFVDATGADAGNEWVELYNRGASLADLEGCKLTWTVSSRDTPSGSVSLSGLEPLAPDGRVVIGDDNVESAALHKTLSMGNGNAEDSLRLVCGDVEIDAVYYGVLLRDVSVTPAVREGAVLMRLPDGADTDTCATDFVVCATATPGAANACAE